MLEKFGEDSQIDVAIEEMSELIKELVKYKRSKIHFRERQATSRANVVEEISDVAFMLEYLKKIFEISDEEIVDMVLIKASRTERRYLNGETN
jgi:NTP pyrophosphatase (non-canonical NTP hydrolase)